MVSVNEVINKIDVEGARKIWGKHSLTLGELFGIAVMIYCIYQFYKGKGKKWLYAGIGFNVLMEILF